MNVKLTRGANVDITLPLLPRGRDEMWTLWSLDVLGKSLLTNVSSATGCMSEEYRFCKDVMVAATFLLGWGSYVLDAVFISHSGDMDRFTVQVISKTPNPQQTIYAAMHQDYAETFVWDDRENWPSESECGDVVVKHLLKGGRGHYGPLEHPQIVLNCGWFPHSTMQQMRTHRVGVSFDVQCLAGDTEITFVKASGALKKTKISELYDLWCNGEKAVRHRKIRGRNGEPPGPYRRDCKKRLKGMHLRVLNEATGYFETSHIREVMCSGLQPVYRLTLENGRTLDCTANHRLLTSDGWQTMGEATGLETADDGRVVRMNCSCSVMSNGTVVVGKGLYRDEPAD